MNCKENINRTIEEKRVPLKTRPSQSPKHLSHTKPILRLGWYLQVLIATSIKKLHHIADMACMHLTMAQARGPSLATSSPGAAGKHLTSLGGPAVTRASTRSDLARNSGFSTLLLAYGREPSTEVAHADGKQAQDRPKSRWGNHQNNSPPSPSCHDAKPQELPGVGRAGLGTSLMGTAGSRSLGSSAGFVRATALVFQIAPWLVFPRGGECVAMVVT